MSMSAENLVGQRCLRSFYTGVISYFQQQVVSKLVVGLIIPIIGSLITIWDKILFKLRVYFDGMVIRKKVFLESSHHIDTHLDLVVKVF